MTSSKITAGFSFATGTGTARQLVRYVVKGGKLRPRLNPQHAAEVAKCLHLLYPKLSPRDFEAIAGINPAHYPAHRNQPVEQGVQHCVVFRHQTAKGIIYRSHPSKINKA